MSPARNVTRDGDENDDLDDFDQRKLMEYKKMMNKGKKERQAKRDKIQRDHDARMKDLRIRIQAVMTETESIDPMAHRKPQLEQLRRLSSRKIQLEDRITQCIAGLEVAFNTTSREVQAGLLARAAEAENL